jgi:hypothetical protein
MPGVDYSATGVANAHTPVRTQTQFKHQLRKLMFEDALKKAEVGARGEATRGQLREETPPLAQSG